MNLGLGKKAEITVIRKYFSDILRIMSKRTRNFNVPRCWSVESAILSETFLSSSFNLGTHPHGKHIRNESHSQWVTCAVGYFRRFLNMVNR